MYRHLKFPIGGVREVIPPAPTPDLLSSLDDFCVGGQKLVDCNRFARQRTFPDGSGSGNGRCLPQDFHNRPADSCPQAHKFWSNRASRSGKLTDLSFSGQQQDIDAAVYWLPCGAMRLASCNHARGAKGAQGRVFGRCRCHARRMLSVYRKRNLPRCGSSKSPCGGRTPSS